MSRVVFKQEFHGPAGSPAPWPWSRYVMPAGDQRINTGICELDGEGNLEMEVRNENQSAALWTKGAFTLQPPFTATARMLFPVGALNTWGAFWWAGTEWATKPELDVVEWGGRKSQYQGAAHLWRSGVHEFKKIQPIPFPAGFDPLVFHDYTVRVSTSYASFLLDGVKTVPAIRMTTDFYMPGLFCLNLWPATGQVLQGLPATLKVARIEVTA